MIAALILPLLMPLAVPALVRWAAPRLGPAAAMWALTGTACALAVSWLAALGGLLLAGTLTVTPVGRLGHLIHPLNIAPSVIAYAVTALTVGTLAVCATAMTKSALYQLRHYRTALERLRDAPSAGDLSVLDQPEADAYAFPGNPGRIVVTSGMLRTLEGPEREALFAHERAHLAGRHHYFLATADLATRCLPGMNALRDAIALAIERVADEAAAHAIGDRHLTARAISRAALAGAASRTSRPSFAAAASGGPVPQRVKALLQPTTTPHRLAAAAAGLLLATSAATGAAASTGLVSLHHHVEVAQGEIPGE
ncbi:M56 family metallopeptidase [Streptomyces sp. NPDC052071]|uniref:M56 family metallopeptidase n=1 Tax=Streptomyces TaxID=1883 RepID=UPI0026E073C4|nr:MULTISPECIES: M56 family metallopeptidase [unclassified Streptomyces]MDX2621045.1 M56 family metallopeptidase [Streptomyces sp. WI03-5b]MDX3180489.1 M56 family metallopeptidase [Streptomyces sp. ME02-7008A-1]MDX3301230.1 M56 family metallopeptidase [Streptomyces sp. ME02-7008A]